MPDRKRRMLVLGSALAALPGARAAAPGRVPRVGLLLAGTAEGSKSRLFLRELREGLREVGRDEGRGYVLDVRSYAACDVLVSETSAGARALKRAAPRTPIVVAAALERPVGQATGFMRLVATLDGKLTELAHELLPRAKRLVDLQAPADLARLGDRLAALQADALVVAADARLFAMREAIVREALAAGVPAFGPAAEFAELGAVASYGCDVAANFRAAARYVDRLLQGAKAAELPVGPPQRFELVLNLKTARALHLELPNEALLRADRVIDWR